MTDSSSTELTPRAVSKPPKKSIPQKIKEKLKLRKRQKEPSRRTSPGAISRRRLLPELVKRTINSEAVKQVIATQADLALVAQTTLGAWLIARGMHIPDGALPYLLPDPRINFIPSAHAVPKDWPVPGLTIPGEKTTEQLEKQIEKKDPHASVWPDWTLKQIDRDMRAAAKAGRDYWMETDGQFYFNELGFPYPLDLSPEARSQYPKHIYGIGGDEVSIDFFVGALAPDGSTKAVQDRFKSLSDTVAGWYDPYTKANTQKSNVEGLEVAAQSLIDIAIARGLLNKVINDHTRRQLIKTMFWTLASIKFAGDTSLFAGLAGFTGDPQAQRILSDLQSATSDPFPGGIETPWVIARTAFAVEKADYISRQHNDVPVDVIYGNAHADQAPGILTDKAFRMDLVRYFMKQHIKRIADTVNTSYPDLKPHLSKILYFSVCSIPYFTINEVNVPWGEKTVSDGLNPLKSSAFMYCPSLYALAEETLTQSGVDCSIFPRPTLQNDGNIIWTGDDIGKDYSKGK